ncbi:ribonuclease iii [Stemphylium lycopersici]|uniref:Ribonuclease iii n=1 Tax=Stemphylium lycopersici TaxID=183478 RepID=A0A364N7C9_STELY|nr:ribonuclease iii [Stemphylium lycopersici]RAR13162.1 ribonuclease iii [Stemphylium lycopersici]
MSIDSHIAGVEAIISYIFQDKSLCAEALQMQTSADALLDFGGQLRWIAHNSRLELLGDRINDAVLCKKWYESCDAKGQGSPRRAFNALRNDLVTNEALGTRGFQLGLDRFVLLNLATTTVSMNMMANTFEAIVGAVYLDAGDNALEAVYNVLEHTGFFEHPMLVT